MAAIDDVILGTSIHGTGRTVGQTRAALGADPDTAAKFATFNAVLNAVNSSNNIGRNGPVCIYTTGQTTLAAWKRFWIDETGVHVLPAVACPRPARRSTTSVLSKDAKLSRISPGGARASKRRRLRPLPDSTPGSASARGSMPRPIRWSPKPTSDSETKVRTPLENWRAFPRSLKFFTQPWALAIEGQTVTKAQLAAPNAPPQLACQADSSSAESIISVCIHESEINNVAENVLIGMKLDEDMVQRWALELFGSVPEKLKPDQNQEPFTIGFPPERIPRLRPVEVSFADNGFTVTLHGQDFISGDRHLQRTNVAASYKFVKTPDGYKAVRQGDVQIYDFDKKPGTKVKRSAGAGHLHGREVQVWQDLRAGNQTTGLQVQARQASRHGSVGTTRDHLAERLAGDRLCTGGDVPRGRGEELKILLITAIQELVNGQISFAD